MKNLTLKNLLHIFAAVVCISITFTLFVTGLEVVINAECEYDSYKTTTYTQGLGFVAPDSVLGQQHASAVAKHEALVERIDSNDHTTDGAIQKWFRSLTAIGMLVVFIIAVGMSCISVIYLRGELIKFLREFNRNSSRRRRA
ncbi:MAG: hypothetical protein PHP54_04125 [Clostridia bacterium]|nr:hypothetical protein [Clostridia bacterium]